MATSVSCIYRISYCKLLSLRSLFRGPRHRSYRHLTTSAYQGEKGDEGFDTDSVHHTDHQYDTLYPGHINTTFFQKSLLAFGSGIACLLNPARDDMICALGETTGFPALKYMHKKMLADPVGQQILEEKPVITTDTVNVTYLETLPENTFGKAYWHFLNDNGFSPDARRPVNFVDDKELMYVMLRYRQCHDLVHTLLGMPPNMLGEVAVKWFEAIQTGLPMCVTAALFGPIRLGPMHRQKYINTYLPWAVRSAYKAKFLMNVYFEKHWEQDLDELRNNLNVEPCPVPLKKTGKKTMVK